MSLLLCFLFFNLTSESANVSYYGEIHLAFSVYEDPTHRTLEADPRIEPGGNQYGLTIGNGLYFFETLGFSVNAYSFHEGAIVTEWGPSLRYRHGDFRVSLHRGIGVVRLGMSADHLDERIVQNVKVTGLTVSYLAESQPGKKLWLSLTWRAIFSDGLKEGDISPNTGGYQLISTGINWDTDLF